MKDFILKSDSRCLRLMLLSHLGEELTVRREENPRCCRFCNEKDKDEEEIFGSKKQTEDEKPRESKKRKPITKKLMKETTKALEDFRREKVMLLPESTVIHGLDMVIFGKVTIKKLVREMGTILTGEDVLEHCDGMVRHYADEIAKIICDMKAKDDAERAERSEKAKKGKGKSQRSKN